MSDPVARAREELATLDERPVDEHPDVFAELNDVVAAELSAMEDT